MANQSHSKAFRMANAVWIGVKKPLVCAVIMLAAAMLLISLEGSKKTFDRDHNATYQLVSDPELAPGPGVHVIPVQGLAEGVNTRIEKSGQVLPGDVDPNRIVRRSAEEIANESFKNRIELATKLAEGINKQKNEKLKPSNEAYEKAVTGQTDLDRLASRAINQLTEKAKDGKVDVAAIRKSPTESAFSLALKKDTELRSAKEVSVATVKTTIERFYEGEKKSLTDEGEEILKIIKEIDAAYQAILAAANEELPAQMKLATVHSREKGEQSVGFLAAPAGPVNPTLGLILDDSRGLVGVYWLLRLALTGTVLFAILYLILIPLKHLFFWTASGDLLTEYVKKLLDNKSAAIGSGAAKAAIVTLAAVGVAGGTALAINGLPFSNDNNPTPAAIADELGKKLPRSDRVDVTTKSSPTPSGTPSDTSDASGPLAERIDRLEESIVHLAGIVGGIKIPAPVTTDPELTRAIRDLNGFVGPVNARDDTTLFGKLNVLKGDQETFKSGVNGRFNAIDGLIGTSGSALDQPSLFGKLNRVSDSVGARSTILNSNSLSLARSDLTVIESLRSLGDSSSTGNSTLFGSMNRVADTTTDTRRDQLGTGGRNLSSVAKQLLSGEQYRMSRTAYEEIARNLAVSDPLRAKLEILIDPERTYSKDGLRRALGALLPGVWKAQKERIFKYTRVATH